MKIRCKNCYRVLDRNEEYCKSCGAHSEQMKKAMETGNFGGGPLDRFKIGFLLFVILAFLGNGIIMTIFAVIKEDASSSIYNKSHAMLFSSLLTFLVFMLVHYKDLKDFLWNGTTKQLINCLIIGGLFVGIVTLFSLLTDFTKIIPVYITDYLNSGTASWFSGEKTNLMMLLISLLAIVVVEEVLFRRLLIDALDDATLLSDTSIILIGGIVGTILDFAWLMASETLIVTVMLNLLMTFIYINSNRSLGLNILIRVFIIIMQFVIFIK